MKRFDIEKKFTEIVSAYLMNGWVINSKSMSGHQGEEGKIDLVKGKELIRVWMVRESSRNWSDRNVWHGETMYLRVGMWTRPASDCIDSFCTVWFKDIDVLKEWSFYEISGRGESWYVEDLDEALWIQKKREANWTKRCKFFEEEITCDRSRQIATKFLKRSVGYKRVATDNIKVHKHYSTDMQHAAYYVNYNGNTYRVY